MKILFILVFLSGCTFISQFDAFKDAALGARKKAASIIMEDSILYICELAPIDTIREKFFQNNKMKKVWIDLCTMDNIEL